MELWKYLLAADKKLNLSDPDAAWKWIQQQNWQLSPNCRWTPAAAKNWRKNLDALKCMSKRLKSRSVPDGHQEADTVVEYYVGMLRPTWRPSLHPPWVLELMPTVLDPVGERVWFRGKEDYLIQFSDWEDWDYFWQLVFRGLLTGTGLSLCKTCGAELPKNPNRRRPSRRETCDSCQWQKWRAKQPKKKMREKWKEDKANQRETQRIKEQQREQHQ